MLVSSLRGTFQDYYRSEDKYGHFEIAGGLSADSGYFRFGENAICYGRTAAGSLQMNEAGPMYDVLQNVTIRGSNAVLPFDPNEVVDNLRYERYMNRGAGGPGQPAVSKSLAGKIYYMLRPFMPVSIRKHLQRRYLKGWDRIAFPSWPVDRTVENIFEQLMVLSLRSHKVGKIPFVWFWPEGYTGCAMMTHDIETEAGRDFCKELVEIDASFGIKSSYQIVPEERYEVPETFLDFLRSSGCEVNLHGDNHDGTLFSNREDFLRRIKRINQYAKEYGAVGFRSPVLYRNLEWYDAMQFSYDMSVPASAHLEPQRGGCCTVMPYFVGDVVELPLTTTQDYSLWNILRDRSIELWKKEIDLVLGKNGLVSFNTHPDYIMSDGCVDLYRQLLQHLTEVCAGRHAWLALPKEVDLWWRQRRQMELVSDGGQLRVRGPSSERAVVAYASLDNGRVIYELPDRQ